MNFFIIDIDLDLICAFDEALLEIRHSYSFCISIEVIAFITCTFFEHKRCFSVILVVCPSRMINNAEDTQHVNGDWM